MTCLFDSIPGCMLTTAHEIFHLHIHDHFFEAIKNVVGEEKAHDIKEAVTTTLLNLEFRDLWSLSDKGYEKHAELRRFIEEQWKKEKDFYSLLEKCVLKLRKSD